MKNRKVPRVLQIAITKYVAEDKFCLIIICASQGPSVPASWRYTRSVPLKPWGHRLASSQWQYNAREVMYLNLNGVNHNVGNKGE